MKQRAFDLADYLRETRRVSVSLTLIFPLFLAHELLVRFLDGTERHVVGESLARFCPPGGAAEIALEAFAAVVIALAIADVWRMRVPVHRLLAPFIVESVLLALLLGPLLELTSVPVALAADHAPRSLRADLVLSLGAGIYEELVFRLLLLGGLYVIGTRALAMNPTGAFVVALLVSSAAFTLFHHVGVWGEPFERRLLWYRSVAGILLGLLFLGRGLGVVVWVHALYDVLNDLRSALFSS